MTSNNHIIKKNKSQELNPPSVLSTKHLPPKWGDGKMRVAIVHDFLTQFGGAERVLKTLSEMFPQAPIYTLLADEKIVQSKFSDREIRTSFLQKFPKWLRKRKRYLLPLMPTAPETFDLREFDLVISSSGAWSKGIVTRLDTIHIAYIHSPMRFVWDWNERYLESIGKKLGIFKRLFLSYLRLWDYQASQRPDILIANSEYTKQRIWKYYLRESEVAFPPINISNDRRTDFQNDNKKNYFLVVSRLSPYKKVDLVVRAFNKLELPLLIIGEGEQKKYLRKIAKSNVKILGWQSEEKLAKAYQNARALIFPTVDDFGLTMTEAMSYGTPVIAVKKGGAKEIVKEEINGLFFKAQTPEVLADGVRRFMMNEKKYDKNVIMKSVEKFSKERFMGEKIWKSSLIPLNPPLEKGEDKR